MNCRDKPGNDGVGSPGSRTATGVIPAQAEIH